MTEKIIRLSELTEYHQVKEVYENSLACFEMNSHLVNIDTIPPVFALSLIHISEPTRP